MENESQLSVQRTIAFLHEEVERDEPLQETSQQPYAWLDSASSEEVDQLLDQLQRRVADEPRSLSAAQRTKWNGLLVQLARQATTRPDWCATLDGAGIERLYRQLPADLASRHRLLMLLAAQRTEASRRRLAELIVSHPPSTADQAVEACSPLWRLRHDNYDGLFPRLLDGLQYPSLAVVVLDLANFLTRRGYLPSHPARSRSAQLIDLLGRLTQQLAILEERPPTAAADRAVAQQIGDSVALIVALCDALALMEATEAVGKLLPLLELTHRRVRVEAAAALVRLQEDSAVETLVQLAAEPVVRLRVLAYAQELNLLDQMPAEYRTDAARAEGEVAARLAEPGYFGLPPSSLELLDHRTLYWPGYDQPIDCFLLRFEYRFPNGTFRNVALAGPVTHCFAADLTSLSVEDCYAAFAGWQAEHAELKRLTLDPTHAGQQAEVARLTRRLNDDGFAEIQPLFLSEVFGQQALVAQAVYDDQPGIVAQDAHDRVWVPRHPDTGALLPPEMVDYIYKGRKLLRTFNPEEE